eukprot:TRINITY_DN3391_c0_g1_i4.p1 TRINITY_DN3391_c0_g1~~TRINITY_DN3391_c0_g1_i4.p1  ORF type:complete len:934 (-),score=97.01 TRINITY_DN3391_c0_g1_i4:110-2911(-)
MSKEASFAFRRDILGVIQNFIHASDLKDIKIFQCQQYSIMQIPILSNLKNLNFCLKICQVQTIDFKLMSEFCQQITQEPVVDNLTLDLHCYNKRQVAFNLDIKTLRQYKIDNFLESLFVKYLNVEINIPKKVSRFLMSGQIYEFLDENMKNSICVEQDELQHSNFLSLEKVDVFNKLKQQQEFGLLTKYVKEVKTKRFSYEEINELRHEIRKRDEEVKAFRQEKFKKVHKIDYQRILENEFKKNLKGKVRQQGIDKGQEAFRKEFELQKKIIQQENEASSRPQPVFFKDKKEMEMHFSKDDVVNKDLFVKNDDDPNLDEPKSIIIKQGQIGMDVENLLQIEQKNEELQKKMDLHQIIIEKPKNLNESAKIFNIFEHIMNVIGDQDAYTKDSKVRNQQKELMLMNNLFIDYEIKTFLDLFLTFGKIRELILTQNTLQSFIDLIYFMQDQWFSQIFMKTAILTKFTPFWNPYKFLDLYSTDTQLGIMDKNIKKFHNLKIPFWLIPDFYEKLLLENDNVIPEFYQIYKRYNFKDQTFDALPFEIQNQIEETFQQSFWPSSQRYDLKFKKVIRFLKDLQYSYNCFLNFGYNIQKDILQELIGMLEIKASFNLIQNWAVNMDYVMEPDVVHDYLLQVKQDNYVLYFLLQSLDIHNLPKKIRTNLGDFDTLSNYQINANYEETEKQGLKWKNAYVMQNEPKVLTDYVRIADLDHFFCFRKIIWQEGQPEKIQFKSIQDEDLAQSEGTEELVDLKGDGTIQLNIKKKEDILYDQQDDYDKSFIGYQAKIEDQEEDFVDEMFMDMGFSSMLGFADKTQEGKKKDFKIKEDMNSSFEECIDYHGLNQYLINNDNTIFIIENQTMFLKGFPDLTQIKFLENSILAQNGNLQQGSQPVSYTHLRAHETGRNLVCRLLLEKKKKKRKKRKKKQTKKTKRKTSQKI